jgi:predicted dehydrogenase
VDLAVSLSGSLIQRVSAIAIAKPGLSSDLWDDFSINLEMANGSVATIIYTSVGDSASPKERIEVSGAGKTAIIEDFRAVELWSNGKRARKSWWSQDKGQREEMQVWVDSLRKGSCPIPLEQIINVHRACFAAMRSIKNGVPVNVLSGAAAAAPRRDATTAESKAAETMSLSKA